MPPKPFRPPPPSDAVVDLDVRLGHHVIIHGAVGASRLAGSYEEAVKLTSPPVFHGAAHARSFATRDDAMAYLRLKYQPPTGIAATKAFGDGSDDDNATDAEKKTKKKKKQQRDGEAEEEERRKPQPPPPKTDVLDHSGIESATAYLASETMARPDPAASPPLSTSTPSANGATKVKDEFVCAQGADGASGPTQQQYPRLAAFGAQCTCARSPTGMDLAKYTVVDPSSCAAGAERERALLTGLWLVLTEEQRRDKSADAFLSAIILALQDPTLQADGVGIDELVQDPILPRQLTIVIDSPRFVRQLLIALPFWAVADFDERKMPADVPRPPLHNRELWDAIYYELHKRANGIARFALKFAEILAKPAADLIKPSTVSKPRPPASGPSFKSEAGDVEEDPPTQRKDAVEHAKRRLRWAEMVKLRLRDTSLFLPPHVQRMATDALLTGGQNAAVQHPSKLASWSRRMTLIRGAAGVDPTTNGDDADKVREERSQLDECKSRAGSALDRLVKLL